MALIAKDLDNWHNLSDEEKDKLKAKWAEEIQSVETWGEENY